MVWVRVAVWRTGFELLLLEHSLGPTERPAAWVMKWARDTAPVDVFHVRSFEWAFGRLVYATSALGLHRPFLAPQCSFTSSSLADAVRAVLACVPFFIRGDDARGRMGTVSGRRSVGRQHGCRRMAPSDRHFGSPCNAPRRCALSSPRSSTK